MAFCHYGAEYICVNHTDMELGNPQPLPTFMGRWHRALPLEFSWAMRWPVSPYCSHFNATVPDLYFMLGHFQGPREGRLLTLPALPVKCPVRKCCVQ